ncbi:DMT family transporter [Herbaspirillum robiniae]|uniref:Multidrug DMT transporter permease n=1 Tax=Herbaspirillum robiniae TaxID=2014887 RepID=A0A246WUN7_9BURK|nr:DMT family transporter [Herbaspirillum robiniae]OWY30734.1 multidrug DMT transporter permease [Herbaspirillum robiniae]
MSTTVLPTSHTIAPTPKLWLGIIFLVTGLWTLSLLDSAGKLLAISGYHVVMIAWMRYTINVLFMAATLVPLYQRRTGRSIFRSNRLKLQLGRGALLLGSTLIFFSVLRIVPLAEGTAMNFCAPLIVLAVSPWLLGERSYVSRWIAVLVGFSGMLIVIRPGGDIPPHGVALGLLSAFTMAMMSILNRKANQADDPMVTLFYGALVGSALSTLAVPFFWSVHSPDLVEWAILISTGITGTIGHFLQNSAYRHAEASVLTPFFYAQIISASGMGWLVFGQFPDGLTVLGIAIICASGVGIALIERRRHHRLPAADPMESV